MLPVVVITELEAKRHHAELGYFARTALRHLDDLRIAYGRLDAPVPVNEVGGTVHVELNHTDPTVLPAGFRLGDNDSRILAVALNFAAEGRQVTLVSKDLPMRVKASAVGLRRGGVPRRARGRVRLDRHGRDRGRVRRASTSCTTTGGLDCDAPRPALPHRSRAARRLAHCPGPRHAGQGTSADQVRPGRVRHPRPVGGAAGRARPAARPERSASSRWVVGRAPASRRSRCVPGSRRCWSAASTRKVVVFRPLYAVGGQELGYLPGHRGREDGALGPGGVRHPGRGRRRRS